jgi:hypothetical protein
VPGSGFTAGATIPATAEEGEDPEIGIIAKIRYFLKLKK